MLGLGNSLWLLGADPKGVEAVLGREWLVAVVVLTVLVAPFLLGNLIGRILGLKDLSQRISIVLLAIFFSASPFVFEMLRGEPPQKAIRFSIDLAGGTNLNYAADQAEATKLKKNVDIATIEKMMAAIRKRINPSGTEDVIVQRVGSDRIEVIIPGVDPEVVRQKKEQITKLGSLDFGILANERDHSRTIAAARALDPKDDNVFRTVEDPETGASQQLIDATWHAVEDKKEQENTGNEIAIRKVTRLDDKGKEREVIQFLVMKDPPDKEVTGRFLSSARGDIGKDGLEVHFTFNPEGAFRFYNLTGRNLPDPSDRFFRRLAILLDGKIKSSPVLRERISGSGQISGSFTQEEIDALVSVLNAGALEVPLIKTPKSEFTISPLLGSDVQKKGFTAITVSAAAIFLFMLIYYRLSGFIACLCLLLNLLLVVGSMAFISSAFSLPGLAGLVLTIGMAVDSNVLIYERMREELAKGVSFRIAIQQGFDKALAAIVDSNVASLLTAVILYLIGSDLIRGFAVSLFIGLSMSMFSVLYFGQLAFEIIERKKWAKSLSMMQFMGETNIDFLSKKSIAYACSLTLIGAGLVALFARGSANMDIDFSGGTMVTFEFKKPQTTDSVRTKLNAVFPNGVSLERLTQSNESQTGSEGRKFRVRSTELNREVVSKNISTAFSDSSFELVRVTMENGELKPIETELSGDLDRFKGGTESNLTFSGPIASGTVADNITSELDKLKGPGDVPKYPALQLLVHVVPKESSKSTDAANVTKYTEFTALLAPTIAAEDGTKALQDIKSRLAIEPVFDEISTFDTSVADETKLWATVAVIASLVMIVLYIWLRFEKVFYGYAAVVALAHDVLVTMGAIALAAYLSKTPIGPLLMLEDFKFNMGQVACLLTIVGYSLNDTIVIFDRIREIKGKNPRITYDMINQSVNQTLSRTLLTALSTFIVVVVLYLVGGEGIHGFAFSMIVGVITGCYSTVYIANPILLWLVQRQERLAAEAKLAKSSPLQVKKA